jgi:hypothetical protein
MNLQCLFIVNADTYFIPFQLLPDTNNPFSILSPFPAPPTGGELATPTLNSLPLQGESEGAHLSIFTFQFSIFNL